MDPAFYEYKFIVDGKWMHDPNNPEKLRNIHGTWNSILDLTKSVTFILMGYDQARRVFIAGTFNDWNPREHRMKRIENRWQISLDLPGGKHLYKFVVNGDWILRTQSRNSTSKET